MVDVDDTIANTQQAALDYYRMMTGDYSTSLNMIKSQWFMPELCPKFSPQQQGEVFNQPQFFRLLEPLPRAQEGTKFLKEKGYDVRICTLHRAEGIAQKDEWIQKHFPHITERYYYTNVSGNKDAYKALSIIDDNPKNILTSSCEHPILFDFHRMHTNLEIKKENIIVVNSWDEIIEGGIF